MQTLQVCQTYFSMLGIAPTELKPNEHFCVKNFQWLPVFVLIITSLVVPAYQEIAITIEFMFSIFMISGTIAIVAALALITLGTRNFYENIDVSDRNLTESKYFHGDVYAMCHLLSICICMKLNFQIK